MATDPEPQDAGLDLERVRQIFEDSTDFTVGIEEEFAIVDPDDARPRAPLRGAVRGRLADPVLAPAVAGELIDTEIEIRSGRGETFADAVERQRERRERAVRARRVARGWRWRRWGPTPGPTTSTSTSSTPSTTSCSGRSSRWVAQRNNTWSLHVHVGVRGADRAVAVSDWMRELLPPLLALSAPTRPSSTAGTPACTASAPRSSPAPSPAAGSTSRSATGTTYADFVGFLTETDSIVEATQLWWCVRPASRLRHRRGADLRRPDARRRVVRPRRPDRRLRRPDGDGVRRARL